MDKQNYHDVWYKWGSRSAAVLVLFKHSLSILLLKADIVDWEIAITVHAVRREFRANTLCNCCFLIKWHEASEASVRTSWGQRVCDRRRDRNTHCTLKSEIWINVKIKLSLGEGHKQFTSPSWKRSMTMAPQPPFSTSLDLVVWWGLIPQLTYYHWTGLWLWKKNELRRGLASTLVLMQSNCQRDQSNSPQIRTN